MLFIFTQNLAHISDSLHSARPVIACASSSIIKNLLPCPSPTLESSMSYSFWEACLVDNKLYLVLICIFYISGRYFHFFSSYFYLYFSICLFVFFTHFSFVVFIFLLLI